MIYYSNLLKFIYTITDLVLHSQRRIIIMAYW